jgi:preprotein translocase subunit SecY
VETADNLKKHGGFVPGIRPGKNTADYFDYVLTRLTVLGAGYLAIICVLPEILISQYSVPFYFGGTSLLIVVSVTMDTVAQIHSHLIAHQYEGLIKKAKLKPTREMGAAPRLAQGEVKDKSSILGKLLGRKGG